MSPCTYHSHTSTTLDLRYQVPVGPMVYDCPVQLSCSVQLSVLYLLSPYCGTSTGIVRYYYTMYLLLTNYDFTYRTCYQYVQLYCLLSYFGTVYVLYYCTTVLYHRT
jgi:hypothetical protein